MYLEIYVDVIFFINFIMDIILLLIVKKIVKYPSSKVRLCCGAGVGAVGACILAIAPNLNGLIQFLISYIIICFAMIYIAFKQKGFRARLKAILLLYISTFFLGGVLNSLYYNSKLGYYFLELINGRLLHKWNLSYFILALIVGIGAVHIFVMTLTKLRSGDLELYQTELTYGTKNIRIVGLLDTGNNLYDPIYGKPVIITEYLAIKPLLSQHERIQLGIMLDTLNGKGLSTDKDNNLSYFGEGSEVEREHLKMMMIPYHSIGRKNGMLPAIVMDMIEIWNGDEKISSEKVITAISLESLSGHKRYQAILHKDVM